MRKHRWDANGDGNGVCKREGCGVRYKTKQRLSTRQDLRAQKVMVPETVYYDRKGKQISVEKTPPCGG